MGSDAAVQGSMEESVRNAKAKFARIETERLRRFIEMQDGVRGPVVLSEPSYSIEGAGASNGIAFCTAELDRGSGREVLDLVLRYSPGVQLLKQKSYEEEFRTLQAMAPTGLPVPEVLWLDADGSALGRVGYVMRRVHGDLPSAAMYSKGPLANIPPEVRKERMLKAAAFHGKLRKAALGADRVPHLAARGTGRTAIERELNWWSEEVSRVWDAADAKAVTIAALRDWLIRHEPNDLYAPVLVHGDAQIANMIYADGEVAAMLDWELSYLGHNESDLALLCLLTEAHQVVDMPVQGTPTDAEYIDRFEQESGCRVRHWPYFRLMNLYRVVSAASLSAEFMPSFEAVWSFYAGHMNAAWSAARTVYES